jgi:tetrahydromethanopterin S-methyltransferase subunit G
MKRFLKSGFIAIIALGFQNSFSFSNPFKDIADKINEIEKRIEAVIGAAAGNSISNYSASGKVVIDQKMLSKSEAKTYLEKKLAKAKTKEQEIKQITKTMEELDAKLKKTTGERDVALRDFEAIVAGNK